MLNKDYYLDAQFLMGQPLHLKKCELMWEHISSKRKLNSNDIG